MPLILLISFSIHSCYIGSKVVVSLLALELGASQVVIGLLAALGADGIFSAGRNPSG